MFRNVITNLYYRYYLSGFKEFKKLEKIHTEPLGNIKRRELIKLNKILNYAYKNVPYYQDILSKNDLLINNKIVINSFSDMVKIPILTKEIIRSQGERLYSVEHDKLGSYKNTSGGSTGEPVIFIQDRNYIKMSRANYFLINSWRKRNLGDSEVVLWGAQRDLYGEKKALKGKIVDFVLNKKTFNSARMSADSMQKVLRLINKEKPKLIFGYVNSLYELALFAEKEKIKICPQRAIHTGAGKLHDFMRSKIEEVFKCKVFDHYGSREVGSIASECKEHDGLHILSDLNYLELVDVNNIIIKDPNKTGDVLITQLSNFSMPLIRYKIEDQASFNKTSKCNCGSNYPKLAKINGRSADNFKTINQEIVSGEYLTLTFNFVKGVEKFQIIQNSYLNIDFYLVVNKDYNIATEGEINLKMKKIFSNKLNLRYFYKDEIRLTETGKHLFTICKL